MDILDKLAILEGLEAEHVNLNLISALHLARTIPEGDRNETERTLVYLEEVHKMKEILNNG